MPTPPLTRRIALPKDATVTQDDRIAIADYLATIQHDDELFMRCVRKAVRALKRYNSADIAWCDKWLPIIERTLNAT